MQDSDGVFERLAHEIELGVKQACMLRGRNGDASDERTDLFGGALAS